MCNICGGAVRAFGELLQCRVCGHIFQADLTPTVRYDAQYLSRYDTYPVNQMSYLRLGFLKAFKHGGRLLDIGCGNGVFVRVSRQAGFHSFGHDVHGADVGVPMVDLDSTLHWDVVTLYDSLEHMASFSGALAAAARAGCVIVSTPWTPNWFPLCREWKHYKPGEHLHYFRTGSLRRLFQGKRVAYTGSLEDAIRGRRIDGGPNILTMVFQ
jgi:hypothetical protein